MIKKILFSLVCVLTLCITFVSTKVSADTPEGYTLIPIVENQQIPYGTELYYDFAPTGAYDFTVAGTGIADGSSFIYTIEVSENKDGEFEWLLTIKDDELEIIYSNSFMSQSFTLQSVNGGPPVEGNFTCLIYFDNGATGQIGLIEPSESEPTEPNVIYSGIFELLADTLYGGTENLTQTQIGLIEWFSILITISCLLLPFIIVFFVIKLLFK